MEVAPQENMIPLAPYSAISIVLCARLNKVF